MTRKVRFITFLVADIIVFNISYLLAFTINGSITGDGSPGNLVVSYFDYFPKIFMFLVVIKVFVMLIFSIYRILFEYASIGDYKRVILALATGTAVSVTTAALAGMTPALQPLDIFFSLMFDITLVLVVRYAYLRVIETAGAEHPQPNRVIKRRRYKRVMIIGSGRAAADLIAEMQHFETRGLRPEITIDDDKSHEGGSILGVKIAGGKSDIRLLARRHSIDEIVIAMPDTSKRNLALIINECIKTRCEIEMLPLIKKKAKAEEMFFCINDLIKPTAFDLLGREIPRIDHRVVIEQVKGKVILITGGAGVFGSELCQQIVKYKPRRVIALDLDEDALTILEAEISPLLQGSSCDFKIAVASVRDKDALRNLFAEYKPHIVFHAAELKHIPLAQLCPRETFLTNTIGLMHTAELAEEYSAEKFILISTPKAATQNNVFSACKRMAEVYLEIKHNTSQTIFSTVRFPNLIDSDANVVSIFSNQIEHGGPITVTAKDTVRYFMSAEEAATLTLLSETLAEGGELFDIAPGEPMEIVKLAEAMIRLSGAVPDEDIEVIITQLRPGERVHEEMAYLNECDATPVAERINLIEDKSGDFTSLNKVANAAAYEAIASNLSKISSMSTCPDDKEIVALLRESFPAYQKTLTKPTIRGVKIVNE